MIALGPIAGFIGLASAAVLAYAADRNVFCFEGWLVTCPHQAASWLIGASLWSGLAIGLAVLIDLGARMRRLGRSIQIPGLALVVVAFGLVALGIVGIWIGQETSYGRMPPGVDGTIWLTYVTSGLLIFGLAFTDGGPRVTAIDQAGTLLSVANGLMAAGWGFAFAYTIVFPPQILT